MSLLDTGLDLPLILLAVASIVGWAGPVAAQPFVHPGGLHDQVDLDRMRDKVAADARPWVEGWNKLCDDPLSRDDYRPTPAANMGVSRQRASKDAHAAYLNFIRGYISGDVRHTDCAIRICNAWSAAVNEVPHGDDIPGLSGIPIAEFALVGELLRTSTRWQPADFERFKAMMRTYWYPVVHEFLSTQNAPGNTRYWANWNIANMGACLAIGVFLDDRAIFDEGVQYFKSDVGTGSIKNAVFYMHPGNLGQWQETGRDQPHAELGVGMMAQLCEVAWKQGVDLYGEGDNRLLAGAEYVAQWDMWRPVPYKYYTNSDRANQSWPSINGRGRLNRPVWELLYNHYVVRKGLDAPNTKAMAQLLRVEGGSADHFGYGTLTFTMEAEKSPFPPSPIPPVPTDVVATAGIDRVFLRWTRSGDTAQGYEVRRAATTAGPFTSIASWADNTRCEYIDAGARSGTTYLYEIAARNQSGTSGASTAVSATPAALGPLAKGWTLSPIGEVQGGDAGSASVGGQTFVVKGSGIGLGRVSDQLLFVEQVVSGDVSITARISDVQWARKGNGQKIGIMIRETLAADAPIFLMKLGDVGARQAGAGTRKTPGGEVAWVGGNDYTWIPAWFRLTRAGNSFAAYESSDGEQWFKVSTAEIPMQGGCHVGLFVSSGGNDMTSAQFDHVSVTP